MSITVTSESVCSSGLGLLRRGSLGLLRGDCLWLLRCHSLVGLLRCHSLGLCGRHGLGLCSRHIQELLSFLKFALWCHLGLGALLVCCIACRHVCTQQMISA